MFVISVEQVTPTSAEETLESGVAAEATIEGINSSEATMTPEHKVDTAILAESSAMESGVAGEATTDEEGGHSVEATKGLEADNSSEATMTDEHGKFYLGLV